MRVRLIAEIARRLAPTYSVLAVIIVGLGWFSRLAAMDGEALPFADTSHVAAIAMTAAWLLAMMAQGHLQKRECVQLPISRRDIWRSRWWLASIVPGAVAGAAATISAVLTNRGMGQVLIITVCCAAWGGLQLLPVKVPTVIGGWFDAQPAHSPARKFGARFLLVWVIGWLLAPLALPFLLAPTLVKAAEFSAFAMTALVAAFLCAAYVYTPPTKERPPVPRVIQPQATKVQTAHTATTTSGITGLRFLYWKAARRHLTFFAVTLVGVVAYWLVAESRTYSLTGALGAYWLLPFDRSGSTVPVPLVVLLFMWLSQEDVQAEVRRLRTLPMSGWSLSIALILRASLAPLLLWIAGLLLHLCVRQTLPVTWHVGALLLATGAVSFLIALTLSVAGSRTIQSLIFATVMVASFGMNRFLPSFRPSAAVTGLALLTIAPVLCEWALQRRSQLYARRPSAAVPERFS